MNLLFYTARLYKKIKYYDKLIKSKNYNDDNPNPFRSSDPLNLTVIWTQDDYK